MKRKSLVVHNAKNDKRFATNPFVLNGPKIVFYAGAVLRGPTNKPIGALCLMDKKTREFNYRKQQQLIQFARLVEHELCYSYYLNELRVATKNASHNDFLTGLPTPGVKRTIGTDCRSSSIPSKNCCHLIKN